jgi:hypothetical protein
VTLQWEFGLGAAGQADLYIDGNLIVENSVNQKPGLQFVSLSAIARRRPSEYNHCSLPADAKSALASCLSKLDMHTTWKYDSRISSL